VEDANARPTELVDRLEVQPPPRCWTPHPIRASRPIRQVWVTTSIPASNKAALTAF
jgi:hypothetical protein